MFVFTMPVIAQTYKTEQRSKAIHVVYDDSASMIVDDKNDNIEANDEYLDRWCQAKYAMEVFAAMLEEKDTMRVYFMSEFHPEIGGNIDHPARIVISGSAPAVERVNKIHNDPPTYSFGTPFDPVVKAYNDLRNTAADTKWLVVLTDGDFDRFKEKKVGEKPDEIPPIDVDAYLSQFVKESDVNIIFLAMGEDAKKIKDDPNGNIYFEHAKNNDEILEKITLICNRIFNRNKLKFTNQNRYEFSFDIPMTELLVFAQGPGVKVNGINGGKTFTSETVNVRYSEKATTNPMYNNSKVVVSKGLTGTVTTFRNVPNIPKGSYSLELTSTGSQIVEIYYKPVVNVDIKLLKNGKEVKKQDIEEGRYKINFGIVNENGDFSKSPSKLLEEVDYKAEVQNGDRSFKINNGDTVKLNSGDAAIKVSAHFLEINTAENSITRKILPPKPFKERFLDWIHDYWYIFWPLVCLLLAILLWWLLWGRKKRFPKYMSKKPVITIENESGSRIDSHSGSLKIVKKTKWLPLCPEKGTIIAYADGRLPSLKVKALGNGQMELTNTSSFTPDSLHGIDFFINEQPVPEGSTRNKIMSCTAQIKSIYYNAGVETTHICSFAKKGKKRRK
jgi:hypothetical protein